MGTAHLEIYMRSITQSLCPTLLRAFSIHRRLVSVANLGRVLSYF